MAKSKPDRHARRLQRILRERDLSHQGLADLLGVDRSHLSKMLRGERGTSSAVRIAAYHAGLIAAEEI
jgi:transcriptional regulator with XRE-family HTH domain